MISVINLVLKPFFGTFSRRFFLVKKLNHKLSQPENGAKSNLSPICLKWTHFNGIFFNF